MEAYIETESTNPEHLLAAIADGNTDALAQLYNIAGASVYSYALSILKNSHDAEDVMHDCFVRIYSSAGRYRSEGKAMAWIMTITRNLCLARIQERKKTVELCTEDWKEYIKANSVTTPDDKLVLFACMENLSDDERQIVVLHAVSGFKHREIAQIMNLTLSTVLSKYHRAIKKLKVFLGKEST